MVKCAIKTCGLRKENNHGLTFHRIPRNEIEKKKWIDVIGSENISLNIQNNFICSMHFEDSCFNRTLEVVRLRNNSVPSLHLQNKVTSGPSPKCQGKISYPSVEIKYTSGELLDPLCDAPDPLAPVTLPVPPEPEPAAEPTGTADTNLSCMQTAKMQINTLTIRWRALHKKLNRYRQLLRRRDKKMAALQADVESLQNTITEHNRAAAPRGDPAGSGETSIQVLSSKDGVVKETPNRQILFIKRGVTRQKSPSDDLHSLELLQDSPISVIRTMGIRQKSAADIQRTSDDLQNSPVSVVRTMDIRQKSPVSVIRTMDIRQKSPVGVQRTSDILPNALVIQIDGKHSRVPQLTLVRLQHNNHMEIG